jgi:ubiquinone/menaquinone biosynthesis C-methylase UbiE
MEDCTNPFETDYALYDAWFDQNANVYQSELLAVKALLPKEGRRIEVGVGSGRFASELGITEGIEPAEGIATLARARGITVIKGLAEDLPLEDESVDVLLYVTTLCFVGDMQKAFQEAYRVLRPGGCLVLAYIPKESPFGRFYERTARQDPFFKRARFYTKTGINDALTEAGFKIDRTVQTLAGPPERANDAVETPTEGDDRGSFVVLRAVKP